MRRRGHAECDNDELLEIMTRRDHARCGGNSVYYKGVRLLSR
jgi:hypothetical protein